MSLLDWWWFLLHNWWPFVFPVGASVFLCYLPYAIINAANKSLHKWIPLYFLFTILIVFFNPYEYFGILPYFVGPTMLMIAVWTVQNLFDKYYVQPRYGSKDDDLKKVLHGEPKKPKSMGRVIFGDDPDGEEGEDGDEPLPLEEGGSGESVGVLIGAEAYPSRWSGEYDEDALDLDEDGSASSEGDRISGVYAGAPAAWAAGYDSDALAFEDEGASSGQNQAGQYKDSSAGWRERYDRKYVDKDALAFDDGQVEVSAGQQGSGVREYSGSSAEWNKKSVASLTPDADVSAFDENRLGEQGVKIYTATGSQWLNPDLAKAVPNHSDPGGEDESLEYTQEDVEPCPPEGLGRHGEGIRVYTNTDSAWAQKSRGVSGNTYDDEPPLEFDDKPEDDLL